MPKYFDAIGFKTVHRVFQAHIYCCTVCLTDKILIQITLESRRRCRWNKIWWFSAAVHTFFDAVLWDSVLWDSIHNFFTEWNFKSYKDVSSVKGKLFVPHQLKISWKLYYEIFQCQSMIEMPMFGSPRTTKSWILLANSVNFIPKSFP
jgi:hypothetical protein